jgi:hypothetical protein
LKDNLPALMKSTDGRFVAARQPDGTYAVSEFNGARRLEPRYLSPKSKVVGMADVIRAFESIFLDGECLMWVGKGEYFTNCDDSDELKEIARMEDDGGASPNE